MNTIKKFINSLSPLLFYRNTPYGINGKFDIVEKSCRLPEERMDWSITHGKFDRLPYKGKGERVAVLDTGVDENHNDLKGQVNGFCFINGDKSYVDELGHGCFCAGEIVAAKNESGIIGVAPEATCFCGKVLYGDYRDGSLFLFEEYLSNAIRTSQKEGCGVISMSLGMQFKSALIEEALNEVVDQGVIPIAALGNEGMLGTPYKSYPAYFDNCIAVASANDKDLPCWFSSVGKKEDNKPDVAIASLEYYWGCIPNNLYGKYIGTSMACPVVAGVALLWRQAIREKGIIIEKNQMFAEFQKWLHKVANDTNKNGWDEELGFGVLILDEGEL